MSLDILFMGRFMSGQSTFISALTGGDMVIASTACADVITTVEFGNDSEYVKVFYTYSDKPEIISRDRFTKELSFTSEEWDILEYGGRYRLANVSHAEIHTNNPLFPAGVRLIISPSLMEDYWYYRMIYNRITCEYVPKANAIIFMLNAIALFSAKEKEYIKENFEGKHLQNVFFVVNRINQLTEPLEENVIPCVKNGLSGVFKDENGKFDEELYQQRVFYVNAYGALCARTGEPYKVLLGRKKVEVPITIEETGFPEFETALWQYLRSIASKLAVNERN